MLLNTGITIKVTNDGEKGIKTEEEALELYNKITLEELYGG